MKQGGRSSPSESDTDVDAEIEHYETMSAEEINAKLKDAGIDAQPTIDRVSELVNERIRRTMGALEG